MMPAAIYTTSAAGAPMETRAEVKAVAGVGLDGDRYAARIGKHSYLAGLTRPGVSRALVHRGGLRADIVEGGTLRPGDVITSIP